LRDIDQRMDFCAQPAAAVADRLIILFLGASALCWCARTMVLSIIGVFVAGVDGQMPKDARYTTASTKRRLSWAGTPASPRN